MDRNNEERQLEAEEPPLEAPFVPVSDGASKQATTEERPVPGLTPENTLDLAAYTCNLCQDYARGGVITNCGHLFCWTCLLPHLADKLYSECPLCQTPLILREDIVPIQGQGLNARPGDSCALAEPGPVHNEVFGEIAQDLAIFTCNRCKDYVRGGVITLCGHLFCWTCLWPMLANKTHPECPHCRTPLILQEDILPFNARPGDDIVLAEPGAVPRPSYIGFPEIDEDDVVDHDTAIVDQFEGENRFARLAMLIDSRYLRRLQVICAILIILVHFLNSMA